jgi:dipeptidyl aminopeptidase/acylaminoacyl peptidase
MKASSQTLHHFDAAQGSRKAKATQPRSIRSTRPHFRQKGSQSLGTYLKCMLVSVTMSVTACSSSGPPPTGTSPMAPSVDLCADTLQQVPAGPTNGKLVGAINQGRILIGIEAVPPAGAVEEGTIALAYIDAGGLHVVPMAHDGTLAHPAWAPDGTIVFDSERAGGRHLFRIATDGSGLTQVTKQAGSAEVEVSFSPDGGRIAYAHYSCVEERPFGIQVAAADGSSPVALNEPFPLHSAAGESDPASSPDGKSVAFVRSVDDSHGAVWVVPAAGGEARRLTSDDLGAAYPRWSPDGKQILFGGRWSAGVEDYALWVVPAAGGESRRVFKHEATTWELEGDWSPDGSQIVFKVFTPGWDHNELRIAAADGAHERTLWVGNKSTAETPHWGP